MFPASFVRTSNIRNKRTKGELLYIPKIKRNRKKGIALKDGAVKNKTGFFLANVASVFSRPIKLKFEQIVFENVQLIYYFIFFSSNLRNEQCLFYVH